MMKYYIQQRSSRLYEKLLIQRNRFFPPKIDLHPNSAIFLIGQVRSKLILQTLLSSIPTEIPVFAHVDCADTIPRTDQFYVEDDQEIVFQQELQRLSEIPQSWSVLLQWLRLRQALRLMHKYEERTGRSIEYCLKLRTDWILDKINLTDCPWDFETIYTHRDHLFFARRAAFLKLSNLYDERYRYAGKSAEYFTRNYKLLANSDWESCRMDCLWYPIKIVGAVRDSQQLRQAIQQNLQNLQEYTYSPGDELISMGRSLLYFTSEAYMPLFLNQEGLLIKSASRYLRGFLDSKRHS